MKDFSLAFQFQNLKNSPALPKGRSHPRFILLGELEIGKALSQSLAKIYGSEFAEICKNWLARHQKKKPEAGDILVLPGAIAGAPDLWLGFLPKNREMFSLLKWSRQLFSQLKLDTTAEVDLILSMPAEGEVSVIDALISALTIKGSPLPLYGKKKEKEKPVALKRVNLWGGIDKQKAITASERAALITQQTHHARFLATLPPNRLSPAAYGEWIKKVAKLEGFKFKFHSAAELARRGAGAFTAVDRGNPASAGGIFEVTYEPKRTKNSRWWALVGKGLCFDTGGYDIKVGGGMVGMKGDMQGSAVALSSLVAAARLGLPYKMKAFLAVTENHISPVAFKADEVVIALNGMSIEVIDTDAEGRMVLADTLCLASELKPELIIDFATLTGMATLAVSTYYSAVFTNRDALENPIRDAGKEAGERVWTFPLIEDLEKKIESQIADISQCAKGRSPDHILAALFLNKFVTKDASWVHVDLAASENEGGLAHIDSMFTGFGVRWTMAFLNRFAKHSPAK